MRKAICTVPDDVLNAFVNYRWPGNIRELKNFIERSVILSRGDVLAAPLSELRTNCTLARPDENTFHHMERKIILDALRSADGKLAGHGGAAEMLHLKRTTLQRKMQRLGIEKTDYTRTARLASAVDQTSAYRKDALQ